MLRALRAGLDKNGDPVQGFLIEIFDKNNNLVASGSTDVNGEWTSPAVTCKTARNSQIRGSSQETAQESPGHTANMKSLITNPKPKKPLKRCWSRESG